MYTHISPEQLIERYILRNLWGRTFILDHSKGLQAHLDRHAGTLNLSSSIVGHIRWQLKLFSRWPKPIS